MFDWKKIAVIFLVLVLLVGAGAYYFVSLGNDEEPPAITFLNTKGAYLKEDGLPITYDEKDVEGYSCEGEKVDFSPGSNLVYFSEEASVQDILEKYIVPTDGLRLDVAFYSPGEEGFEKGYHSFNGVVVGVDTLELDQTIPANRPIIVVADRKGEFCNVEDNLKSAAEFLPEAKSIDSIAEINSGWVLIAVDEELKVIEESGMSEKTQAFWAIKNDYTYNKLDLSEGVNLKDDYLGIGWLKVGKVEEAEEVLVEEERPKTKLDIDSVLRKDNTKILPGTKTSALLELNIVAENGNVELDEFVILLETDRILDFADLDVDLVLVALGDDGRVVEAKFTEIETITEAKMSKFFVKVDPVKSIKVGDGSPTGLQIQLKARDNAVPGRKYRISLKEDFHFSGLTDGQAVEFQGSKESSGWVEIDSYEEPLTLEADIFDPIADAQSTNLDRPKGLPILGLKLEAINGDIELSGMNYVFEWNYFDEAAPDDASVIFELVDLDSGDQYYFAGLSPASWNDSSFEDLMGFSTPILLSENESKKLVLYADFQGNFNTGDQFSVSLPEDAFESDGQSFVHAAENFPLEGATAVLMENFKETTDSLQAEDFVVDAEVEFIDEHNIHVNFDAGDDSYYIEKVRIDFEANSFMEFEKLSYMPYLYQPTGGSGKIELDSVVELEEQSDSGNGTKIYQLVYSVENFFVGTGEKTLGIGLKPTGENVYHDEAYRFALGENPFRIVNTQENGDFELENPITTEQTDWFFPEATVPLPQIAWSFYNVLNEDETKLVPGEENVPMIGFGIQSSGSESYLDFVRVSLYGLEDHIQQMSDADYKIYWASENRMLEANISFEDSSSVMRKYILFDLDEEIELTANKMEKFEVWVDYPEDMEGYMQMSIAANSSIVDYFGFYNQYESNASPMSFDGYDFEIAFPNEEIEVTGDAEILVYSEDESTDNFFVSAGQKDVYLFNFEVTVEEDVSLQSITLRSARWGAFDKIRLTAYDLSYVEEIDPQTQVASSPGLVTGNYVPPEKEVKFVYDIEDLEISADSTVKFIVWADMSDGFSDKALVKLDLADVHFYTQVTPLIDAIDEIIEKTIRHT